MINVMIVDDHNIVREGIKRIIEFVKDIDVIDEACDGEDCINKLKFRLPDIILMDINMPNLDGMATLKLLKGQKYYSKVIMFTSHMNMDCIATAFNNGVDGYLSKNCNRTDIIKAIHKVHSGFKFIQPNLFSGLADGDLIGDNGFEVETVRQLSNREKEVLKLVAVGNINREVALLLHISEQTVKNHLSNIYRKIGCYDRVQAAMFCIKHGLVNLNSVKIGNGISLDAGI